MQGDKHKSVDRKIEALALQGDADAQNKLGRMYEQGKGVQVDDSLAAKWFALAADQNHADAQNNLGRMYAAGKGVPQDYVKAFQLFRKAAERGHEIAQFNVGNSYYEGRGIAEDKAEAFRWYLLSANQGDPGAQVNIGIMYLKGESVTEDHALGMHWLTLACAQGDDFAKQILESARRSGFEWLGPRHLDTSTEKRVLYLRAFKGAELDCIFIAIVALSVAYLGRLVVIGPAEGRVKLQEHWMGFPAEFSFDKLVEYISTDSDSWRAIVYEQVSTADCIVVHASPREWDYPDWAPIEMKVESVTDFYKVPIEDPVTGMGLLRELAYIEAFDRIRQTVLLCEDQDCRELMRLIKKAVGPPGDIFMVSEGELRPAAPKIGALNRKLGVMSDARSVVTFNRIELAQSAPWPSIRLEAAILQILAESGGHTKPEKDKKAQTGVSDSPRRLPPDWMLKVLQFTRVEDLLFIPHGEIKEVNPEEIYKILSANAVDRGCPYCYAQVKAIFFYSQKGTSDAIRGKCQHCGRYSTVVGDMLLDT
jgi:TPR repeat protein